MLYLINSNLEKKNYQLFVASTIIKVWNLKGNMDTKVSWEEICKRLRLSFFAHILQNFRHVI